MEFVREAFPVMEDIVFWYQKGTDFHVPVICISSMEVFHVQFRELLLVTRWLELLKKLEVLLLMLNRETE